MNIIKQTTGRDFEENAFKDDQEIIQIFNELGFKVEHRPQLSKNIHLSSLENQKIPNDTMEVLQNLRLWVLTI